MDKGKFEKGAFFARILNTIVTIESNIISMVSSNHLTLNDGKVLYALSHLSEEGKNQIKYVSQYLHLTPAACSTAVTKLVKYGLLERKLGKDHRNYYLVLTPSAFEFISGVNAYHSRIYNAYKDKFEPEELEITFKTLRKVDSIIEANEKEEDKIYGNQTDNR